MSVYIEKREVKGLLYCEFRSDFLLSFYTLKHTLPKIFNNGEVIQFDGFDSFTILFPSVLEEHLYQSSYLSNKRNEFVKIFRADNYRLRDIMSVVIRGSIYGAKNEFIKTIKVSTQQFTKEVFQNLLNSEDIQALKDKNYDYITLEIEQNSAICTATYTFFSLWLEYKYILQRQDLF